jgi:hypothetical protein
MQSDEKAHGPAAGGTSRAIRWPKGPAVSRGRQEPRKKPNAPVRGRLVFSRAASSSPTP